MAEDERDLKMVNRENGIFQAVFGIIPYLTDIVGTKHKTRIVLEYDPDVPNWDMTIFTDSDVSDVPDKQEHSHCPAQSELRENAPQCQSEAPDSEAEILIYPDEESALLESQARTRGLMGSIHNR